MAHIDSFTADKLGHADLVEEVDIEGKKITKITGVANPGKTITLLLRGSNRLVGFHSLLKILENFLKISHS